MRLSKELEILTEDTEEKSVRKKVKNNKKKRKLSKLNTFLLLVLILMVAGVGVYAWFTVSNRARVENLALIADYSGNLQIADDIGGRPGTYSDALDLTADTAHTILSPVTTSNGVDFYAPNYDASTNTVASVTQITNQNELTSHYIYQKTFYLKAGVNNKNGVATIARNYDIALYGLQTSTRDQGSYIYQPSSSGSGDSAANAIRISFTLDNGTTYIYEPNYDTHNTDNARAINSVGGSYGSFTSNLYQQYSNGLFVKSPKTNESEKLFNIPENTDVRVTMRIWIEGTDNDCTNSIQTDMVAGQIQFISTEIKN